MYQRHANVHDEPTLSAKLDAHGEVTYERTANARDEAMLAAISCLKITKEKPTDVSLTST